ncbi:MAG: hypothetical protein EPO02_02165 [Nitrospirae bacterium]|nr:MAG: hypothetical protein EPO02_02165 [Nitrospirota bacterium]
MHPAQENAIRFNLESARDRARQEADLLRLMLRELIMLWEQGILAARPKKAAAVKVKFETAKALFDDFDREIEPARGNKALMRLLDTARRRPARRRT